MAEQEELKIVISAETVELVQSLAKAGNALSDFGKDGKFSIDALNNALQSLRKAAFSTTDIEEIKRLGRAYAELQNQATKLNDAFSNVADSTRRSRIAVYGLNQVVRDLPFGFIAISNNIPVLIDQLAQLRADTGSTSAAFSSFIKGLFSFAGVSILLSAGISLVTAAVQKYGSLSAAFKELTGSLSATEAVQIGLNKALAEGSGNVATQISKLTTLVNLSNDATIGTNNQKYATQLLVQEVDKLVLSQDLQKQGIEAVSGELLNYAKRIVIVRANIKGFGAVIDDLGVQFAKASLEGVTFTDKLQAGYLKVSEFLKAVSRGQLDLAKKIAETNYETVAINIYNERLAELTKRQKAAQQALDNYIKTETKSGIALVDALGEGIDSEKKREKELERTARIREQLNKKEIADNKKLISEANIETIKGFEARIQAQQAYIKNLSVFDNNYFESYKKLLEEQKTLEEFRANIEIQDAKKLNDILLSIDREYAEKSRKIFNDAAEERKRITAKEAQVRIKAQGDLAAQQDKDIQSLLNIDFGGVNRRIKDFYKTLNEENKLSTQQLRELASVLDSAIGGAVNSLFNALESGTDVFDAIGQSLKQLIVQLAATVIKAAALAAILSLIPGGGAILGIAGATSSSVGNFAGLFKNLLGLGGTAIGGGASPIVGPGGLSLQGQVVFVQRGSDLVGVLNQTSARIGRIG